MTAYPLIFVFPLAMAFAAATDLLTMTIPNRLSLMLLGAFFLIGPIAGLSGQQLLVHLGAGALVLAVGLLLFSLGWIGGGDGKLLAVASLWIGFAPMPAFLGYVGIFGGALALAILAYRSVPAGAITLPGWAVRLHAKGEGIPYGIAIAAAGLAVYPSTELYAGLAG